MAALWRLDPFTSQVVHDYGFDNFRLLWERDVYRSITVRTIAIAAAVTVTDVLLAFPIAFYMAKVASRRTRNLLVVAILMFFFLFRKPQPRPSAEPTPAPVAQPVAPPAAMTPTPATAAAPGETPKAPGLSQEQIERMVQEEMARREASIRRSKEAELEKVKKELARMQAEAKKKKEVADAAANEGDPPPQR